MTQRKASRQAASIASVTMIDGSRSQPTRTPFTAPIAAPIKTTLGNNKGMGMPDFASQPAATLHTANCEPTEMSISPTRITSVIPMATSSTGALFKARSRTFAALKNDGANDPTSTNRTM